VGRTRCRDCRDRQPCDGNDSHQGLLHDVTFLSTPSFPEASGESLTFQGSFHNSLERSMNALVAFRHNKMVQGPYCNAQCGFFITFKRGHARTLDATLG
jgi:hypothetical protein